MLERRRQHRQRVCLEGIVASGLVTPMLKVRLRNLNSSGAEIVVRSGHIATDEVDFCSSRCEGVPRRAKVIWRHFDRYGLEFIEAYPADIADGASGLAEMHQSASAWNRNSLNADFS